MHLFIDEKTFPYIYYTEMVFAVILFISNILISIFLCNEFRKPKSVFQSSYFYILNSFYCLRIPYTVVWVYGRTTYYRLDDPMLPVVLLLQWYTQSLQGMWEAVLGLSRMTALAFPGLHKKFWDGKRYWYFLAIIYLFPFIAHGDTFFKFECKFLSSGAPGCLDYRRDTVRRNAFITISLNVLCLVFVAIGLMFAHKGVNKSKQVQMEKRILLQTVISAASLALLYGENLIGLFSETKDYLITSWLFSMIQFYPPMYIIFLVTPTVKREFIAFYLSFLLKTPPHPTPKVSPAVSMISPRIIVRI